MILVGFITLLAAGISIIVWLDLDFYFKRRIKGETTVFSVLVNFTRERKYYLILAFVLVALGMIFGIV